MKHILFLLFLCFYFSSCGKNIENKQDTSVVNDSTRLEVAEKRYTKLENDSVSLMSYTLEKIEEFVKKYDTIALKDINFKGVHLGDSVQEVAKIWGKPDSITGIKDEMGGYEYVNYWYSKSRFSIGNGIIESFYIGDKRFAFENVKVGDLAKVLAKKYPKSFKNAMYISENEFVVKVFVTFTPNTIDYQCPDFICFYVKNKRIEDIETLIAL